MIVKELYAKLGLDVDEGAFNAAEAAMSGLKGGLIAVGTALASVAVGFVAMVKTTADTGDNIDELAARTGTSTTALQKLGYAASFSGVGLDELAVAMNFLAKHGSKDVEKDMGAIADQIKRLTDQGRGSEAAGFAIEKLGRAGGRLVPVLRGGSAELRKMGEEAEALGKVMSETAIRDSAAFNDSIDRLSAAWVGLRNDVIAPLLPMLTNVAKAMLEWFKANRELIKQRIEKVLSVFLGAVKVLWKVLSALITVLDVMITHWKLFAAVLGGIVLAAVLANTSAIWALVAGYAAAGLASVIAGAKAVAAWVAAAAPVVLLGLLLAALVLIAEDVYVFLKGGDSLIGDIGPKWTKFLDELLTDKEDDFWLLRALKAVLRFLTDIQGESEKLIGRLTGFIGTATSAAGKFLNQGTTEISHLFGGGASPSASVSSSPSSAKAVKVQAGTFNAPITIHAAPGASAQEIAGAVDAKLREFRDAELRATMAAVE